MNASEWISLSALAIAATGWFVTSFLNRRNVIHAAERARRLTRMDVAEALAFDIANKVALHLMLPGDDVGRDGRLAVLQTDLRRLLLVLKECFNTGRSGQIKLPSAVGQCRIILWELATGSIASDPMRPGLPRDHPAISGALKAAANLVEIARQHMR